MYGSNENKTTSEVGQSGGGEHLLPQTGVKTTPIYECRCGAQSSAGSCPRGHR